MQHDQKIQDATDQFSVQEVLDMLEVAARARQSTPSIAPVGLDLDSEGEPFDLTRPPDLSGRRRQLARYVVGAIAVSCVILATSVVKRTAATDAPATLAAAPPLDPATAQAPALRPVRTLSTFSRQTEDMASGLVRFTTQPGWAWLDGHQLTATSAFVPCGTHQVQIGGEEQHDIVVPCGGEVVVTR